MAITMTNYVLTWTDTDGVKRGSAVSYDKGSAEDRKKRLVAAKCTNVTVSEAKPGEPPQPA